MYKIVKNRPVFHQSEDERTLLPPANVFSPDFSRSEWVREIVWLWNWNWLYPAHSYILKREARSLGRYMFFIDLCGVSGGWHESGASDHVAQARINAA